VNYNKTGFFRDFTVRISGLPKDFQALGALYRPQPRIRPVHCIDRPSYRLWYTTSVQSPISISQHCH